MYLCIANKTKPKVRGQKKSKNVHKHDLKLLALVRYKRADLSLLENFVWKYPNHYIRENARKQVH